MTISGDAINQIGMGGMVAWVLIREVFSFLKSRSKPIQNEIWKTEIHDLHKWMTKYATLDSKTLEQVAKTIQTQRELMKEMIFEMRETRKDVNQFKHK